MPGKTNRMPPIASDKMTEAQKKAVADIISGPRGHLVGPFIPLLRSPDFMGRLQRTGEYLRFNSALEPRQSELAILITARHWSQNFEWHAHRILGEKAGLKPAICDAIAEGRAHDIAHPLRAPALTYMLARARHRAGPTMTLADERGHARAPRGTRRAEWSGQENAAIAVDSIAAKVLGHLAGHTTAESAIGGR